MYDNRPRRGVLSFKQKPLEACNRITGLDGFPFFCPHPRVLGFRTQTLESKEKIIVTLKNRQTMNTTKSVHALHKHTGALGIPTKHPRQKKLKASRRKAHQTAQGTASPLILFGKKKKLLKRRIKREHKQLYNSIGGRRAQNWPALLGSHCRRRTMDGSLLAPRMNSSRESFPSLLVSIWRKIFSVLFSGVDSSSGIFITEETIL